MPVYALKTDTWTQVQCAAVRQENGRDMRTGKQMHREHQRQFILDICKEFRGDVAWKRRHVSLMSHVPYTDRLSLAGSEAGGCLSGLGAERTGWG